MRDKLLLVSEQRIEADIRALASMPTRHTLTPGFMEAAAWMEGQFQAIPGLQVQRISTLLPPGRRVPEPTRSVHIAATLPGQTEERLLVAAHLDSLNLKGPYDRTPAPGANDNGSGLAVMLECARVLAETQGALRKSIMFVAFPGEEQGLLGARNMSVMARAEKWQLHGVFTSDMVGNTADERGRHNRDTVRLFSAEGSSRELARQIAWTFEHLVMPQTQPDDPWREFQIELVLRHDRFGRGGDHTPFADAGYPAVRFTEKHENYARQHSHDDLPEHVDFSNVANVARVNLAAVLRLAEAGASPRRVQLVRDQSHDTSLTFELSSRVDHEVYWRPTTSPKWTHSQRVGRDGTCVVEDVSKDDFVFAVGPVGGVPVEAV